MPQGSWGHEGGGPVPWCPSPWLQAALTPPRPALLSPQDALLSLGAVLDVSCLRDALRHALVSLLPRVVGGGVGGG